MVRLLLASPNWRTVWTSVSIPQWCDCCPLMPTSGIKAVARFNPTMVRLLLSQLMAEYSTLARFNPTMVRLLPKPKFRMLKSFTSFNPTMVRLLPVCAHADARLLRVSIPQWCDCCQSSSMLTNLNLPSFNPTMVRLLQGYIVNVDGINAEFQSHNGAIAAGTKRSLQLRTVLVSIPQWCDCCTELHH